MMIVMMIVMVIMMRVVYFCSWVMSARVCVCFRLSGQLKYCVSFLLDKMSSMRTILFPSLEAHE